jgi:hypothetical protein
VPCYAASAQSVLLSWYHEGLNAFEHICPAGQTLYQQFEIDLLHCLHHAADEPALADLLQRTRDEAAATLLALQQGRDRLLELNSFNSERADRIVDELTREERSQVLAAYMEQLFDQFGVERDALELQEKACGRKGSFFEQICKQARTAKASSPAHVQSQKVALNVAVTPTGGVPVTKLVQGSYVPPNAKTTPSEIELATLQGTVGPALTEMFTRAGCK